MNETPRLQGKLLGLLTIALAASSAGTARAELPDGLRYDDGFAYFRARSHGSVRNNRPTSEYSLLAFARILGEGVAPQSAFKFVLKQGRRELHSWTCQGLATYRHRMHPSNAPDAFSVASCTDRHRFTQSGRLSLEVIFVDDDTDEEHLVATHTLDIRTLSRVSHQGVARPSHFFVNQHAFAAVALIDQLPRHHQHMFSAVRGRSGSAAGQNEVLLHLHRSHQQTPGTLTLRCSVDGERVRFPDPTVRTDPIADHQSNATEVRRTGSTTEGDDLHWRRDVLRLPLTFGDQEHTQLVKLDDHPGRWECELRDDSRQTLRELAFTVVDGVIQPHPEEGTGLTFPAGVHLVDVTIPRDSPRDARTDPAETRRGAFYGRRWQSRGARAMGARVPRIGDPYPRSGRSRGR